jgi:nicotinamidase-related amidase
MNINKFFLKREDSALLVIDIQERLATAMEQTVMEQVVRNAGILIETARLFRMPVVASAQYRKGLGEIVIPLREKLEGVDVLEKLHFDCTKDEALEKRLGGLKKKTFVIAGIEAHVCVLQTCMSLLSMGYNCVVASDGVTSRRMHDWKYSLTALASAGAVVYPTETISFMLLEKAGTDEFKKLAPLFKQ